MVLRKYRVTYIPGMKVGSKSTRPVVLSVIIEVDMPEGQEDPGNAIQSYMNNTGNKYYAQLSNTEITHVEQLP